MSKPQRALIVSSLNSDDDYFGLYSALDLQTLSVKAKHRKTREVNSKLKQHKKDVKSWKR